MLGNDVEVSDGIWTCGKDGQSVPVGVGCPTVKIAVHHRRRHARRLTRSTSTFSTRGASGTGTEALCAVRGQDRVVRPRRRAIARSSTARRAPRRMLRQLGSEVRTLDLWDDFVEHRRAGARRRRVRAMVFEAGERPDLAVGGAARGAQGAASSARRRRSSRCRRGRSRAFDPASGFDDFIVMPCVPGGALRAHPRARVADGASSRPRSA